VARVSPSTLVEVGIFGWHALGPQQSHTYPCVRRRVPRTVEIYRAHGFSYDPPTPIRGDQKGSTSVLDLPLLPGWTTDRSPQTRRDAEDNPGTSFIFDKRTNNIDIVVAIHYAYSMILNSGAIRHCRKSMDFPGHAHELTFSCYHGYKLLDQDRSRQWLANAIARARRIHDFHLWSYVIMPEHVHLVLLPQQVEYRVEDILHSIKESVGRRAINFLKRTDPNWLERLTIPQSNGDIKRHFWQPGGGYDRNIVTMKALAAAVNYIHANPVRRNLAATPTDWEWSSARWYEGRKDVKLEMDATLPMLNF